MESTTEAFLSLSRVHLLGMDAWPYPADRPGRMREASAAARARRSAKRGARSQGAPAERVTARALR